MKIPSNKEEFLVWPPIGGAIGTFIGFTFLGVMEQYYQLLLNQDGPSLYAGFLFPMAMGIAFAVRLHGKFWLGFAWMGVLSYSFSWILSLFNPTTSALASLLMVCFCLALMFFTQSGLLFLKRRFMPLDDA